MNPLRKTVRFMVLATGLWLVATPLFAQELQDGIKAAEQGDYATARQIFEKHSIEGDPKAMFFMAQLIHFGLGVQKDEALAAQWYSRSADFGSMPGAFNAGVMYYQGIGNVELNMELGAKYLLMAAERNNLAAQYNIGEIFMNGAGLEKDEVEGLKWIILAAHRGHPEAIAARERAFRRLTTDQSQEAQRRANAFLRAQAEPGDQQGANQTSQIN